MCANLNLSSVDYWEKFYENELKNFYTSKDVGEIWFGKANLNKIIKWICESSKLATNCHIIDIGTGNGVLLYNLFKEGYKNLVGIDFSHNAIKLSLEISKFNNMNIKYEVCNILELPSSITQWKYDLCIDKGTFDAITLNKDKNDSISRYKCSINQLLNPSGLFFIISCNWTKMELQNIFNNEFEVLKEIATPTFTFGSVQGHTVTSLIFKKCR